jgi:hypothetical protein
VQVHGNSRAYLFARRLVFLFYQRRALQRTRDMTAKNIAQFTNIEPEITDTAAAAAFLKRRPQTLRKWACLETGPIRPIRINGRLAWKVSDLKALLTGVA